MLESAEDVTCDSHVSTVHTVDTYMQHHNELHLHRDKVAS